MIVANQAPKPAAKSQTAVDRTQTSGTPIPAPAGPTTAKPLAIPYRTLLLIGSLVACGLASPTTNRQLLAKDGEATITPIDDTADQPVAIRFMLRNDSGRIPKLPGLLRRGDWYLLDRTIVVKQRDGDFSYTASRGPEYAVTSGGFTLSRNAADELPVYVERSCEMRKEDWWSGDLLVQLPEVELRRWMAADDLDLALNTAIPEIDKSNTDNDSNSPAPSAEPSKSDDSKPAEDSEKSNDDQEDKDSEEKDPQKDEANKDDKAKPSKPAAPTIKNNARGSQLPTIEDRQPRWITQASLTDLRLDSGLVFMGWPRMDKTDPKQLAQLPISPKILQRAIDDQAAHIAIAHPWSRDVPIWLSQGKIDSVAVLSTHLQPNKSSPIGIASYNPDPIRFTGPRGLGRLVEYIYWQMLECGFRIAPSAGSGFGINDSHLGYNRVYVTLGGSQSDAQWWEKLKEGRSMVTNGPLLRPLVNGELPGTTFQIAQGDTLELEVALSLSVQDPVEYLEIVYNGKSLYRARLDEHAKRGGEIPPLKVNESGWLLIRVVTDHESSYRFAMTAPYYIEAGNSKRVQPEAVAFFRTWLETSRKEISRLPAAEAAAYQPYLEKADRFWQELSPQ